MHIIMYSKKYLQRDFPTTDSRSITFPSLLLYIDCVPLQVRVTYMILFYYKFIFASNPFPFQKLDNTCISHLNYNAVLSNTNAFLGQKFEHLPHLIHLSKSI